MRGCEISFVRHELIFSARHNSLAAVLDCNGENQQYSVVMVKINNIQLRAQAVVLANVGYSHTVIANKLHRAKSWVTKWINRSKVDDLLVDKPLSGRPKVLYSVARKLIKKAKYRRGHGLSRLVKQLKARGEAGGKDAIRDYNHVKGAKVKNWRRKTQSVVL